MESSNFITIELLTLIFGTLAPILIMYISIKYRGVDVDFTNKSQRRVPLLIGACAYFIGAYILWIFNANNLTIALMISHAITAVILCLVYFKWKISLHVIGIAGAVTALMYLNPYGFILGLIIPVVMWARLTLRKHDIKQLVAGSLYGYFVITVFIYYLTNASTTMLINILWMDLALVTPPLFLSLIGTFRRKGKMNDRNNKIILVDIIIFILIYVAFSPNIAVLAFVLCLIVCVSTAYMGGKNFLWYKAIEIPEQD